MNRKLALIIGNSHYQDPNLAKLVAPTEDVNDLAEVLRDLNVGRFDQVNTLIDETDATIRLGIEDFFADKKPDDLLVLYFSGHGVRDEQGQLYLAVNNTRAHRLRATAIAAEFITKEMDRSRSKRQVLVLDCCHSGAFAQGSKAVTGESAGTGPTFEGNGYGRVVLTATDATQYAWEGDKIIGVADNSLFTHYMVEGLRTGAADGNGDGKITLDEMYDYVYERVVTQTPKQTPGKWSYKQQGDIIIARNPKPSVRPAELPSEVRQLLDDARPLVRETGVRELARLLNSTDQGLVLAALEALNKLKEDDSRAVSSAALSALQAYNQARQSRDEQARLNMARAEADHRAALQAEQDRLTAEKTRQAQLARAAAERERIAARIGMPERSAESPSIGPSVPYVPEPTITRGRVWALTVLQAVIFGLSWLIASRLISEPNARQGNQLLGIGLAGVVPIGGVILSFHWLELPIKWRHFLVVGFGWLTGFISGGLLAVPTYLIVKPLFGLTWGTTCGVIGGIATGLTAKWLRAGLGEISLRAIILGWTIAWVVGFGGLVAWGVSYDIGPRLVASDAVRSEFALYCGLAGAFIGLVGGGITYRQIGRARRAA